MLYYNLFPILAGIIAGENNIYILIALFVTDALFHVNSNKNVRYKTTEMRLIFTKVDK